PCDCASRRTRGGLCRDRQPLEGRSGPSCPEPERDARHRRDGWPAVSEANGTFFRSRWVDSPAGVNELDPGLLPAGFRASGLACGIKPSRRSDIGVVACDSDAATSAALFTRNAMVAAAVEISRQADLAHLRAVVVNSGNANAATEEQGRAVAKEMIASVAGELGVDAARVAVASTGVIGVPLDMDVVSAGARRA